MPAALLVILAAVLWGTTGTAQELGPEGVDPLAVGWIRLVVGGVGLLALARIRDVERTPLPRGWLVVAVASIAAYQLAFFGGVRLAGVALGTAVGIGSAPIFGGLVDAALVGWRPSRRWLVAAGVAIVGVGLAAGNPGDIDNPALGLSLALTAGLAYAVYSMALQRLVAVGHPEHVSSVVFCTAAVILTPAAMIGGLGPLASSGGVLMALHLGLVATTASYALFTRGVRETPVSTAMVLTLAEPITAVLLGVALVGERLTASAAVGVGLLLVGVTMATTVPGRRRSAAAEW